MAREHEPFKPRKPFRERPAQYQRTFLATKLLAQFQFRMGNLVREVAPYPTPEHKEE